MGVFYRGCSSPVREHKWEKNRGRDIEIGVIYGFGTLSSVAIVPIY